MTEEKEFFEYKMKFLTKEIDIDNKIISNYRSISLTIKGWAITLWSLIIIWSVLENNNDLALVGILVCFIFWMIDTYTINNIKKVKLRIRDIEEFLNNLDAHEQHGFKGAFKKKTFNNKNFIPFDPIGRLSKKHIERYKALYSKRVNTIRSFLSRKICPIYSSLIYLGGLMMIYNSLEFIFVIWAIIGYFILLIMGLLMYYLKDKEFLLKKKNNGNLTDCQIKRIK